MTAPTDEAPAFRVVCWCFPPFERARLEERRRGPDGWRWHLIALCDAVSSARALVPPGTLCVEPAGADTAGLVDDWL